MRANRAKLELLKKLGASPRQMPMPPNVNAAAIAGAYLFRDGFVSCGSLMGSGGVPPNNLLLGINSYEVHNG
jgi:hypothetical protein